MKTVLKCSHSAQVLKQVTAHIASVASFFSLLHHAKARSGYGSPYF
jgi:hypothetical protein